MLAEDGDDEEVICWAKNRTAKRCTSPGAHAVNGYQEICYGEDSDVQLLRAESTLTREAIFTHVMQ